uniref:Putative secreted protein n=1 Tax=Anopheles darlingi TaxID=43151 RepID=A0A2M4DGJ8_ANODA
MRHLFCCFPFFLSLHPSCLSYRKPRSSRSLAHYAIPKHTTHSAVPYWRLFVTSDLAWCVFFKFSFRPFFPALPSVRFSLGKTAPSSFV